MDISQEILKQMKAYMNRGPTNERFFTCGGTGIPDYEAIKFFKGQNVVVVARDGSRYLRGEKISSPHTHIDVTRLNEKIAAMELPRCLKQISPQEKDVYLLGKWRTEEDNHE